MSISVKAGVKVAGLQPAALYILRAAEPIWERYNQTLTLTSACEGEHRSGSLHYVGLAADLRRWGFTNTELRRAAKELRQALGKHYDVVVERTHIHVEYQPKEALDWPF